MPPLSLLFPWRRLRYAKRETDHRSEADTSTRRATVTAVARVHCGVIEDAAKHVCAMDAVTIAIEAAVPEF